MLLLSPPSSLKLDPVALGPRDRTRFWRDARHGGLDCLTAAFRTHRYARHAHETYVVGVITSGCETYTLRGVRHYAGPGDVCFVNPGEAHDGEPHGDGFTYRMTYPSIALLESVLADATGRTDRQAPTPRFRNAVIRDEAMAGLFRAAHERLERGSDGLAADECLVAAYGSMLLRHADAGAPGRLGRERAPVARARDHIDAHFSGEIGLAALACVARLSPFHLLRAFRRETGLTPHAYLMSRRVNAARDQLARGRTPADVAAACGFFDQSHLTRVFKAHTGVTPGAFRAG